MAPSSWIENIARKNVANKTYWDEILLNPLPQGTSMVISGYIFYILDICIYPTPPLFTGMTQGQFSKTEWMQNFLSRLVAIYQG